MLMPEMVRPFALEGVDVFARAVVDDTAGA
jgi:hypothetical protein